MFKFIRNWFNKEIATIEAEALEAFSVAQTKMSLAVDAVHEKEQALLEEQAALVTKLEKAAESKARLVRVKQRLSDFLE